MPWNGKLYVMNYVSSRRSGTGTELRIIHEDMTMTRHPQGISGVYTNRFVHYQSSQLIIGPHVIDTNHNLRTVTDFGETRLCGTARHLTDPDNLVYVLGMEGELFELNVHTLEAKQIFDLIDTLGLPRVDGYFKVHFKDCYTSFGRLVVVNNEYDEQDFLGNQNEGTLAEYDGKEWRIIERKPFVCVRGRGAFCDTIFATGWDRASAILKVYTNQDQQWRTYRLPKATHTHDHKWQSEWPRIRETEHERFIMDLHGMFYELSPWAYGGHIWGIKPICQHLWVLGDFCTWRGMFVMGADNASPARGENELVAEPQSGLWFGKTDDLWNFGTPQGWGGPWWKSPVHSNVPSDPYLMTGFRNKVLHLSHDADVEVQFTIEVDFCGDGQWHPYQILQAPAYGYQYHVFPTGFSAHWIRVVSNTDCTATAQLHYT
jgi:hypothetical protein